jgi:hypothetical protein
MTSGTLNEVLPDPLDGVCEWCSREVAFRQMHPGARGSRGFGPARNELILAVAEYLCPRANCNRPSLVFFRASYGNYGYALESAAKSIPSAWGSETRFVLGKRPQHVDR